MGELIIHFLSSESTKDLLGEAARSNLAQGLIVIGILWATMGRKVAAKFEELKAEMTGGLAAGTKEFKEHARAIEEGVKAVAAEVNALKITVANDLKAHSQRLGSLETGMVQMKEGLGRVTSRVETLEQRKDK